MTTTLSKLIELREVCDTSIATHQQSIDDSVSFFKKSLYSLRSNSQSNALNQVKLGKLKAELRELEDELVKALAARARKEAKRIAIADSLSETRIKVDKLQKIVQDQASRKVEYAAILSEQSKALAESEVKSREAIKNKEEIQEACEWYNRVLGFRIDGGHVIHCEPQLNNTEESVKELNKSNGLFKFVRVMREKFQAAESGSTSEFVDQGEDCTSISISGPVSSASIDSRNQSTMPLQEVNSYITQTQKRLKTHLLSPVSVSSHWRSPRILVTVIHCEPQLNNTEQSVEELNKSSGLFKFVKEPSPCSSKRINSSLDKERPDHVNEGSYFALLEAANATLRAELNKLEIEANHKNGEIGSLSKELNSLKI